MQNKIKINLPFFQKFKNKKNKVIISTIIFTVCLMFSISALAHERNVKKAEAEKTQNPDAKIVLYYSDTCPHCKNVEKFIEENAAVREKVNFVRKEVHLNRSNAEEMLSKATACGIDTTTVGIPFLWDGENGNECLMGDKDIIAYLKTKANIQ